jgi:hypothetical protein
MGTVRVTTFHPQRLGDPELPLAPEAKPHSSVES